ncbi:hypothetical protein B484DRAFT_397999 [Ochromonadaceae sp. CCMP2298]|nr:hypothetical protein B484DRAFT_397999 [Ochromonadaceae sp. CCMP2298]
MVDTGHSLRNCWKTKLFVFEITDGNNEIFPIAMDMYPEEAVVYFVDLVQAGYGVRVEDALKGEYEVYVKDAPLKRRTVNFRAGGSFTEVFADMIPSFYKKGADHRS